MLRKFLATLVIFALFLPFASAYETDSGCEHPFIDILDHWSDEEICFLYTEGIVEGHSERNFFPNNEITRAEFLKISLLSLGYVVTSEQNYEFSDISPGDWYYRYITFAHFKDFIEGYDDGTFKPNNAITRAEAVVMIMGIAGIIDYDASSTINRFYDVSTSDWYAYAVAAATDYGVVEGYSDGGFHPNINITRAEAAAITRRVWDSFYES